MFDSIVLYSLLTQQINKCIMLQIKYGKKYISFRQSIYVSFMVLLPLEHIKLASLGETATIIKKNACVKAAISVIFQKIILRTRSNLCSGSSPVQCRLVLARIPSLENYKEQLGELTCTN